MNSIVRVTTLLLAAAALSGAATAAEPPGPRSGPYPRQAWAQLADLPDLTGVWETQGGMITPNGAPLTPAAAARLAKYREARDKNEIQDVASANCLPPGIPINMVMPYPIEILITPGQVTIVMEAFTQVRHIYTDGRPLPEDPDLTFNGNSVGRWEKDTLVAESIGFVAETDLAYGVPHSDKVRIVERFRLAAPDKLEVTTIITDPEVLTAPWTLNRTYQRRRGWTIKEYVCFQNNRHELTNDGKAVVDLKQ